MMNMEPWCLYSSTAMLDKMEKEYLACIFDHIYMSSIVGNDAESRAFYWQRLSISDLENSWGSETNVHNNG
jgi:hypothetical protein